MKQALLIIALMGLLPSCTTMKEQVALGFEGVKTRVLEERDGLRISDVSDQLKYGSSERALKYAKRIHSVESKVDALFQVADYQKKYHPDLLPETLEAIEDLLPEIMNLPEHFERCTKLVRYQLSDSNVEKALGVADKIISADCKIASLFMIAANQRRLQPNLVPQILQKIEDLLPKIESPRKHLEYCLETVRYQIKANNTKKAMELVEKIITSNGKAEALFLVADSQGQSNPEQLKTLQKIEALLPEIGNTQKNLEYRIRLAHLLYPAASERALKSITDASQQIANIVDPYTRARLMIEVIDFQLGTQKDLELGEQTLAKAEKSIKFIRYDFEKRNAERALEDVLEKYNHLLCQ